MWGTSDWDPDNEVSGTREEGERAPADGPCPGTPASPLAFWGTPAVGDGGGTASARVETLPGLACVGRPLGGGSLDVRRGPRVAWRWELGCVGSGGVGARFCEWRASSARSTPSRVRRSRGPPGRAASSRARRSSRRWAGTSRRRTCGSSSVRRRLGCLSSSVSREWRALGRQQRLAGGGGGGRRNGKGRSGGGGRASGPGYRASSAHLRGSPATTTPSPTHALLVRPVGLRAPGGPRPQSEAHRRLAARAGEAASVEEVSPVKPVKGDTFIWDGLFLVPGWVPSSPARPGRAAPPPPLLPRSRSLGGQPRPD